MKVYLVYYAGEVFDEFDSNSPAIYGVFSTRELAEANQKDGDIHELIIDEPISLYA